MALHHFNGMASSNDRSPAAIAAASRALDDVDNRKKLGTAKKSPGLTLPDHKAVSAALRPTDTYPDCKKIEHC